jgi:hypothetical protein
MVEKCRIETSVHLRRHKLNKPAEVIIDDDDVEVLENRFSYDNCIFNAALRGEREYDVLSTPSFMDRTGTFLPVFDMDNSIPADGTDKEVLENSYDNCIFNAALCREGEYHEINVDGADMDNSKLESNHYRKIGYFRQPEADENRLNADENSYFRRPTDEIRPTK